MKLKGQVTVKYLACLGSDVYTLLLALMRVRAHCPIKTSVLIVVGIIRVSVCKSGLFFIFANTFATSVRFLLLHSMALFFMLDVAP